MAAKTAIGFFLAKHAELPEDTGTHGAAVQAIAPVRILRDVATAARLGRERGFELRVLRGRRSLRGDGILPVFCKKALDLISNCIR